MTDVLGFAAYLLLPLIGIAMSRLDDVRALPLTARIAIAGAAGALITAFVMSAMSLAGVEWSRTRLVIVFAILAALGFTRVRNGTRDTFHIADVCTLVVLAITAYGLLTARETTGDLLFFWGPKGAHFFRAGAIDAGYLRDPNHFFAHRDYPPLLPLLFAWSNTISREFSWWAAVLASGLFLCGIIALIRACGDALSALLAASVLAWAFGWAQIAGGADPLLLFFEAVTVTALISFRDARSQTIVAAIGLAGAVLTKVEGASFAIAVIVALLLERRPSRRLAAIALPAAALLGAWLLFLVRADLLDTYRGPGTFTLRYWREVLAGTFAAARYNAFWIPWIAPIAIVLLAGRNIRRARLPLTIAALTILATLYFYLKSPTDPNAFWIPSSAQRVLLTPLLMLLIAQGQVASASTSWIGANGTPE
ncbi:MAG TPA: hypothetical protein VJZ00_12890 [Thermoanaerobaculia bacterium]|nr:hypothetical protein [Thermoanaerobaculia bacterium]